MYSMLASIHVIFAGFWLVNFLSDFIFRKNIKSAKNIETEKKLISLYMKFVNLLGIVASVGLLVTGITLVEMNDGYSFFQFSANHWLTAKQFIMVLILGLIFALVIPTAKKLRKELNENIDGTEAINAAAYKNLDTLYNINMITNLLVLLNVLFGITHYLYV